MDDNAMAALRVTIPIIIAIGAAIYKTATLRSIVSREWERRVYTCSAGLDELALNILYELYQRIGDKLDDKPDHAHTTAAWPDSPPLDPSSLQDLIERYAQALKFKDRMQLDYARLMRVGPIMIISLFILLIVVVFVSLDLVALELSTVLSVLVYALGGLALVTTLASLSNYVFLQHRLTNAEILSREGLADA